MRLVKVSAPTDKSTDITKIAFSCGIGEVSIHHIEVVRKDENPETKAAIDVETSTTKAKRFVDALLAADFYRAEDYSIIIRQPRSIFSRENLRELTKPIVEPATDILEELWQFSRITIGFAGRNLIAACLLAFGLIHQQILLIIAGLLFMQLLPLLLAIAFGTWTRNFKLSGQSFAAFLTAVGLQIIGGIIVALFSQPPLKYDEFNSLPVGFLISLAVGAAAGLANIDDAGRREFLGLAATAQIAIIPVWFGSCFVFGFPSTDSQGEIAFRAFGFILNVVTIVVSSMIVYIALGAAKKSQFKNKER